MNLADKLCYPFTMPSKISGDEIEPNLFYSGLTFRERLIIALASNSAYYEESIEKNPQIQFDSIAQYIIMQADAIIRKMKK